MKKKWITGLVMGILIWTVGLAAAMPVGVLPEDATGITVVRQGENPANSRLLYEGDRLQGAGLEGIDIRWHPGAKGVLTSENEMIVRLDAIAEKSWLTKVQEFIGFGEAETRISMNVTRGQHQSTVLAPLPGVSVTLLADEQVPFAWGNASGRTLVFEDENKNIVFRKTVTGLDAVRLSPAEIGLRPGAIYNWQVEGLPGSCQVVLLDTATDKQVIDDLQKIDSEPGNLGEKMIKKAAYLQLVSDVQPYKMDLYWLSYRLLADSNHLDAKLQATATMLQLRVADHLMGPVYDFTMHKE